MASQELIGLTLSETLTGFVAMGARDPVEGRAAGELAGTRLTLEVLIAVESVARFIRQPDHVATLTGGIEFGPLGGRRSLIAGVFNVFTLDPETGHRQMTYQIEFSSAAGERFCLFGKKRVVDDPGFDVLGDLTTLFVTLHAGPTPEAPLVGAGQLFFSVADAPRLLASLTTSGESTFADGLAAKLAFLSFILGQVRDVYLADINPLYDAGYQNLVLGGQLRDASANIVPFFLVCGVHSPGFPWGDGESFSDLLLLLGDEPTTQRRFALTHRAIEGLCLDLTLGNLAYQGPLFELTERTSIAFSELWGNDPPPPAVEVTLELSFEAKRHALSPFPFRVLGDLLDRLSTRLRDTLRRILPAEALLGFHILPHSVTALGGTLRLSDGSGTTELEAVAESSYGEAEETTIRKVREPTLLYGYLCAVAPEARVACVEFHASTLRNERHHWGKDRLDAWLGALISHCASQRVLVEDTGITVTDLNQAEDQAARPARLRRIGPPLIEVRNDHFPTAVLQRRIVQVENAAGERYFALEEAMDVLRRESIDSDRKVVVAAIRDPDKRQALRSALAAAGLLASLDAKCSSVKKSRADLRIVIKPNFMFAYDRLDHTTYTDPELVGDLVAELRTAGYRQIQVVEAQSTYGEYFDGRQVRTVAEYLGYAIDGSQGYEVVDLSEDQQEQRYLGPHLGLHPVPVTWRDADYRISFAKNKTHSYAFYTLTLKNIYGALSLANKFKEYHIGRDIYQTTIEYLQAFPVDFGLIDAHLSADGPFGIFADAEPNMTETILAGADLVSVDWVGASKMGLDPRISPYMELAVAAFGKPRIELVGEPSVYRPWLNVPQVLTLLAHFGIDSSYHFGNLFYLAAAHMDPAAFPLKPQSALVQAARAVMEPVREAAFLQAGGRRSAANRALSRFFVWLGT